MLVTDMITRIRSSTHDDLKTGYTDEDLLGYINDGVRFLRRIVTQTYPPALIEELTGTLEAEQRDIVSEKKITQVFEVYVDGRKMKHVNPLDIKDKTEVGTPAAYYRLGLDKICVYPKPRTAVDYTVAYIPDQDLLKLEDDTPFSNDFDDFLVEYAVIRASISDEFRMSQEQTVMSAIVAQVEALLLSMRTPDVQVGGYWNKRTGNDDYGRWY